MITVIAPNVCVTMQDGSELGKKVLAAIAANDSVTLDFLSSRVVAAPFLSGLLNEIVDSGITIKERINVVGMTEERWYSIIASSVLYHTNPAERRAVDNAVSAEIENEYERGDE